MPRALKTIELQKSALKLKEKSLPPWLIKSKTTKLIKIIKR